MKLTESARRIAKSRDSSTSRAKIRLPRLTSPGLRYVVCVQPEANVDLEPGKVYRVVADEKARRTGLLRIVDDSGEDYLYPTGFFKPILAPARLFQSLTNARRVAHARRQSGRKTPANRRQWRAKSGGGVSDPQ